VIDFSNLRYYTVFMRYKRSGSALLVNLLDAHPNAIFTTDRSLYTKYSDYENPAAIWEHEYEVSKQYRDTVHTANGYSYPIKGVGFAHDPVVIGHKPSTKGYLKMTKEKVREFHDAVGLPLKYLHLVRDPVNQVNARWQQKEWRRTEEPVDLLIDHVREVTAHHAEIRKIAGQGDNYLQIHYEDLEAHPVSTMAMVCHFLGLPVLSEHLSRCDGLVTQEPEKEATTWTDETRAEVKVLCKEYPEFYGRYK
jgi:LPS sulfotransferase NodH